MKHEHSMQSRCFKATERGGAEHRHKPSKGEGPDAIVAICSEGQVSQGGDLPLDPKDVSANFQSRIECSSPVYGIGVAERRGKIVGWQGLHAFLRIPFAIGPNPVPTWRAVTGVVR